MYYNTYSRVDVFILACNWLGLFTTEFLLSKEMVGKTFLPVISHTPLIFMPTH